MVRRYSLAVLLLPYAVVGRIQAGGAGHLRKNAGRAKHHEVKEISSAINADVQREMVLERSLQVSLSYAYDDGDSTTPNPEDEAPATGEGTPAAQSPEDGAVESSTTEQNMAPPDTDVKSPAISPDLVLDTPVPGTPSPVSPAPTQAPETSVPTQAPVTVTSAPVQAETSAPVQAETAAPVEAETSAPVQPETSAPVSAPEVEAPEITTPDATDLTLRSSSFSDGGAIPVEYTCDALDGTGASPPFDWINVPDGTVTWALTVEDVANSFNHWVLYNVLSSITELPHNIPRQAMFSDGSSQGTNSFGTIGYGAVCPPEGDYGEHTYTFTLYALNSALTGLDGTTTNEDLERAMIESNSLIEGATMTGVYQRPRDEMEGRADAP